MTQKTSPLARHRALSIAAVVAIILLAHFLFFVPPASAATPVSCGDVLSASGNYVLTGDLNCPGGIAIIIVGQDINLDLGGFTLTGAGSNIGIVAVFSSGVRIHSGSVTSFDPAIVLVDSDTSSVQNIAATNSTVGVVIQGGSENRIQDATIANTTGVGIVLDNSSENRIHSTSVTDTAGDGIGLFFSNNNSVRNNVYSRNGGIGILLLESDGNAVQDNISGENEVDGLLLIDSVGNTIRGNRTIGNWWSGVSIVSSVDDGSIENLVQGNISLGNNRAGISDDDCFNGTPEFPEGLCVADMVDFPECVNTWKGNTFVTDWEGKVPGGGPGVGCIR